MEKRFEMLFNGAVSAARALRAVQDSTLSELLRNLAQRIVDQTTSILEVNRLDLDRMDPKDPKYDRLQLSPERIAAIAADMRHVASLPSPLGKSLAETVRPNGLHISKVTVPLGVVGVIYEARPNVTLDVFALCLKSGNASILKGGSDAYNSNLLLESLIRESLIEFGLQPETVSLFPVDREATLALLQARGYVDVIIPRGSAGLIEYVCQNAKVPVIETGAGIVHTYFDEEGNAEMGKAIITNAKTRRVSVCNALDCLLIHRHRLSELPLLTEGLSAKKVLIYADPEAFEALKGKYPDSMLLPAGPDSFGTEFLDYKMAIRTVSSLQEACQHIEAYGSGHSEAIITDNSQTAEAFLHSVDAATVYVNAPTSFTDGAQFGLGAEIGISTQKLHARGPMGLEALCSYKWLVRGHGQIRE